MVKVQIFFDRKLADAVRDQRLGRMRLVHWHLLRNTVNGSTRGNKHDLPDSAAHRGVEQPQCTDYVAFNIKTGSSLESLGA